MNYKCQSLNCDSKPMCYCQCTISPIFLCNLHTIEHFKTNKVHKINDILIRPIPETRLAIIQKLKEIKTSINNSKYLVNSDSFEIIKLLNKLNQEAQNHFKSLIKKCNDLIRIAMQDEIFEIKDGNCIENLLRLQHAEAEARLRIWNVHEITINSTAIQELIAKNFDISKFDPLDWLDEQNLCSNDILLFKEGTKQLINYNLSSLQVLFLNQDILRETINSDLSLCVLPNKSKFCYGNDTGLAFVIDHKNDISMIENGKPNSCFSSNYYENFVYAIGGASKLAEKYNLQTNK